MKKITAIVSIVSVIILCLIALRSFYKPNNTETTVQTINLTSPLPSNTGTTTLSILFPPVTNFKERVTKKPFGIYITPQNSPIQPERFTGYHTGADAEYQDVTTDVPVYAAADGTIKLARTASGYGGVMIEEIQLNGSTHSVLYGHIRPSSLPKIGQIVTRGEQIGLLGTGYSQETDGERRHLHFAVLADNRMDLLGYVQTKTELSGWIDPLGFF